MRVRRPALLAAGLLTAALLPAALPGAPASADGGPFSLGYGGFERVVLDEAHGQLFLSSGRGGTGVRVTDLVGGLVRDITGLDGATGLALTPDGTSLWVAVPSGRLVRLDTGTYEVVQTIATRTGVCPGDVAVVGSRLVYGSSCLGYVGSGPAGGVGVVDAVTGASYGATTDVPPPGVPATSAPTYRPVVAAGPAGRVYAADSGSSTTDLWQYDVSGPTPVVVGARASVCGGLGDLAARPDGAQVVTGCGTAATPTASSTSGTLYDGTAKLTTIGSYPAGLHPVAGAWSADGATFVSGVADPYEPDVYVYAAATRTTRRVVDLGASSDLLQPRGLAVSRDGTRVWAVARSGSQLVLHVLDVPAPGAASLTVAAAARASYAGTPVTLTGRLAAVTGAPLGGEPLTLTRAATGAAPVALPTVTTAADGSFTVVDTPPGAGSYSYTVQHPSDGAFAQAPVLVWSTAPALTVTVSRDGSAGTTLVGAVQLRYSGSDSTAGQTVALSRSSGTVSTPLPSVVTDANGAASFRDSPPAGTWTYTATVGPNGVHPAASATSGPATVLAGTTLTVSAAGASAGDPVVLTGRLSAGTAAVTGATVTLTRSGCAGVWTGSATTGAGGAWSVSDPTAPVGTCAYRAAYAGGSGYGPSDAGASAVVAPRPSAVGLTVVRGTASTKKNAYVTAHLTGGHTNRTLVVTAQPVGGLEVTIASGTVDANGDLTATYQPRTTTTYRARYAGDDWYASASATSTS